MSNHLLPIGSVVQLQNSTARVMVAGYLATAPSRPGYVWDYSGFKFPLGYVRDEEIYCFDQDQIEVILALGYQDSEQFAFIHKLEQSSEKVKEEEMRSQAEGAASSEAEPEKAAGTDTGNAKQEEE